MKVNKVYCLFEQSGTFKNVFKNLGIDAEDYDISNDFDQTDHQIDVFAEIDKAYEGKKSIFDEVGDMDLVLAFFPCTRFEAKIPLGFRGELYQQQNWESSKKLEYSMKLHEELHHLYMMLCKLFQISLKGGWKMIVENPYTQPHYLTMYFPIKPKLIIKDRSKEGDYYKKPTQFYFVNCEPVENVVFEPIEYTILRNVEYDNKHNEEYDRQVNRSLMHPQFADRFVKTYILDKDGGIWVLGGRQ